MTASARLALCVLLAGVFTQTTQIWADGDSHPSGPAGAQAQAHPASATASLSPESLSSLVDRSLSTVAGVPAQRSSDAEFLRRVSLDLIGMPPTSDAAREFLNDSDPEKRAHLVDHLLASPHYPRHLAAMLDVMLMERRPDTHVNADEWQAWLMQAARENRPWNVLVREMLAADGDDPAQRAAARFALDRGSEANLLTRDVARIFFGRDIQCAQCHDHPLVDDYLQADYHGLLACLAAGYEMVRKDGDKQITLYAEKAGSDVVFESVFFKGTSHRTGARLPGGITIDEPFLLPGEEYRVPPADNIKPVPVFSRRAKLAELATDGSNAAFNENIVNRLWAHMFGRGLVHPLDLHHSGNAAIDPELLRVLGERFAGMNYDIRGFLRGLALSQTYQRAFDLPPVPIEVSTAAANLISQLEQARPTLEQRVAAAVDEYSAALDAWNAAEAVVVPIAAEVDAARTAYAEAKGQADEAAKAVADASAQLEMRKSVAVPIQQAAAATQQAAQLLAEDAELARLAQTLAVRSQQLETEVAALSNSVAEKMAALQPLSEAMNRSRSNVDAALEKLAPHSTSLTQTEQTLQAARRNVSVQTQALAALDRQLGTARHILELAEQSAASSAVLETLAERWSRDFTVASLKPLTPEQLCWSVFRVTGVYERYWQAEAVELDKAQPLTEAQKQDAAQRAARAAELEQRTFDKLKGNVGVFVTYYGAGAGQPQGDFFATVDQALFAANGGSINSWVAPAADNVTERIIKQTDPRAAAEELYLAVLTRMPTEEEVTDVTTYLDERSSDRQLAAQELVWSLLNSAEFRFNH